MAVFEGLQVRWRSAATSALPHTGTYIRGNAFRLRSGLINQSVVAGVIFLITISAHEFMKRKRRGKVPTGEGLGSVESWEFG